MVLAFLATIFVSLDEHSTFSRFLSINILCLWTSNDCLAFSNETRDGTVNDCYHAHSLLGKIDLKKYPLAFPDIIKGFIFSTQKKKKKKKKNSRNNNYHQNFTANKIHVVFKYVILNFCKIHIQNFEELDDYFIGDINFLN
jgi:hypothetical protein